MMNPHVAEPPRDRMLNVLKSLFQEEQVLETLALHLLRHLEKPQASPLVDSPPQLSSEPAELDVAALIRAVEAKTLRLERRKFLEGDWFSRHPVHRRSVVLGALNNWLSALRLLEKHPVCPPVEVLEVLAEAQSAVFALTHQDPHQRRTMQVLQQLTRRQRVHLKRHVKQNDLANPGDHRQLADRIRTLLNDPLEPHRFSTVPSSQKTPLAKRVEPHPRPCKRKIKPSTRVDSPPQHPNIEQLKKWLRNKKVVLVGGEVRHQHLEKYRRAFGCEVDWLPAREHANYTQLTRKVQQTQADVVVILIRWVRHASQQIIQALDVPVVLLKAGYGVSTLAHAIVQQASSKLQHLP